MCCTADTRSIYTMLLHATELQNRTGELRTWEFDAVFSPEASTTDVYERLAMPVVDGVLDGISGSLLAYGQTSSGMCGHAPCLGMTAHAQTLCLSAAHKLLGLPFAFARPHPQARHIRSLASSTSRG